MNQPARQALFTEAQESGELAQLTIEQRTALTLWAQGLGYKRIAARLNISRDAARDRVQRSLSAIKRKAAA